MSKQFLWEKLADFSVLITVGYRVLSLKALSVTCLGVGEEKEVFLLATLTAEIKDAFKENDCCCGFNDRT